MLNWIKNNWKDPVWSKVFASAIIGSISLIFSGIWIIIQLLFRQTSLKDSLREFLSLINLKIPVPLWVILLTLIASIVFILFRYYKTKKVLLNQSKIDLPKSKNSVSTQLIIENQNIGLAMQNYNSSSDSKFLGTNSGIFSIWGYVTDIHNKIHPRQRHMFLIGYATNGGNPLKNPNLADYPNAWAIQRITPDENDNIGVWRFWCNNIEKDVTHLDFKKPLSGGWHLFSVAWSLDDNYIKFLIDTKIVAEQNYANWPTDFSSSIMIGTWANRAGTHFFDSKIGPFKFIESKFKEDLIIDYYNKKPK